MKNVSFTKRACRAGVIAALYVALTYALMPFAFGSFQIRPAEALCILPLFFPEAVPALFVGCALSNLTSPFAVYDVPIGSCVTLLAAFITYLVGRFVKNEKIRVVIGGIPPVLFNATILPFVIVFLCGEVTVGIGAYFACFASLFITQAVWVYGLGMPLYYSLKRIQMK